ncbi:sulfate transporter family-domain-containing protein [Mycena metata]|uniref:Sulfate transporter family-domain-containing protein n=1 Tax=Mycena metata TaxID=1033252 RepID=A0AAD7NAX0_9AGAR|nr:sulfate transporter family-domain-containing protein [Mycena metata]
METAKRLAKRVVAYPEHSVPYVSSKDFVGPYIRDPRRPIRDYLLSLFPILSWISRYNLTWLTGDLIAGLTVGMVLVPQSMSYAQIATLPPQYGLYSSFVGVTVYCLFATSKDVSIGPVAVVSLITSQIIGRVTKAHPHEWAGPEIATTVAFISGFIVLGVGLLRLGWIIEFIPAVAVSGFMTGSAISIAAGQVPGLMGITGFNTRGATYLVIIDTLKGLPRTTLDAAWGLPSLFALYAIRIICDKLSKRYPRRARIFFFISVLRNAFVLLVMTIAAWLYTRHRRSAKGAYPIKILQTVPRGFQHVGQPTIDSSLVRALAKELPLATIVLLLEHIAIAKSFGRLNGYTINPNQELIAIGVTNTVGSVFGAYPATGSFSRSALKAKSGVRTPLAGLVTAVVVIVALYGLTPAFFWIPNASLSAVIIHAVADLVASPSQVYSYWRVSPLEFVIWLAAVLVTVFSTVENGIYVSITTSIALLLIRVAFPRSSFLGKVTVQGNRAESKETRDVYVPLTKDGITNPHIKIDPPAPGVIVYRFEESAIFPNVSRMNSELVAHVKNNMRRGKDMTNVSNGDRPWNDPGPSHHGAEADQLANEKLPSLHCHRHRSLEHVITFLYSIHFVLTLRAHSTSLRSCRPGFVAPLIAGGFGTGILVVAGTPRDRKGRALSRAVRRGEHTLSCIQQDSDAEARDTKLDADPGSPDPSVDGFVPVIETNTPFFHLGPQQRLFAQQRVE